MSEKSTIGLRIKEARKTAGLSQEQLAVKLGIRFQAVQQWERGRTAPRSSLLPRLASELGKSPEWLQFGVAQKDEIVIYAPFSTETLAKMGSAHLKAIEQCIAMGWIEIKRGDVSGSLISDIFHLQLLAEFKRTDEK